MPAAEQPSVAPDLSSLPPAQRRLPDIDPESCTGCGRCVAACGPHLLSLEVVQRRKRSVLHTPEDCTGCHQCAAVCPFGAIRMRPAPG
jgi:ferredoxin